MEFFRRKEEVNLRKMKEIRQLCRKIQIQDKIVSAILGMERLTAFSIKCLIENQ